MMDKKSKKRGPAVSTARIREADVTCPYYRRMGSSAVICDGSVTDQNVSLRFSTVMARNKWVVDYCCAYIQGSTRCPFAGMYDAMNGVPSDPRDGHAAPVRKATRTVRLVLDPPVVDGFTAIPDGRIELPMIGIYNAILSGIAPTERVNAVLIRCGEGIETAAELICTVDVGPSTGKRYPKGQKVWIVRKG